MSFVVDGEDWIFNGWTAAQVEIALDDMLERLDSAYATQQTVWIGDELQTKLVYGSRDLWRLMDPDSPIQISNEIWQELAASLGKAKRYLDENDWPEGFDDYLISINNEVALENPDVAWAHHHVRNGKAVACLGLMRKGTYSTTSQRGSVPIHWIGDKQSHCNFWRAAIDVERDSPETLERLATYAYPDLYFHEGIWRGLNNFSGGYQTHSQELRRYLAALNDHGHWTFTAPPPAQVQSEAQGQGTSGPPSHLILQRFIRLNLDVTPENPDIKKNAASREAREIVVGGKTLYCGWHAKLLAYINRVHIHPPVAESDGKVVIGIFASHL